MIPLCLLLCNIHIHVIQLLHLTPAFSNPKEKDCFRYFYFFYYLWDASDPFKYLCLCLMFSHLNLLSSCWSY